MYTTKVFLAYMLYLFRRLQISFSTHELRTFFGIIFLFCISEGALIFYIPITAERELGGVLAVGILLAIGNLAGLVADVLFGFVSEMTDYRKFMHISAFLSLLILPLILLEPTWPVLILIAILWGVRFELMANFGANIYLAKHAPKGTFLTISGLNYLIKNLGYFLGPIIANFLVLQSSVWVAVILGAILLVEYLLMYMVFNNHPGRDYKHKLQRLSFYSELLVLKNHFSEVFPHFVMSYGIAIFESVFLIFGPSYFSKISVEGAGLLTGIGLLANVLLPSVMVRLITRFGTRVVMIVATIGIALSVLGFILVDSVWLLALATFMGFGWLVAIFVINDSSFLEGMSKLKVSEEDEIVSVRSMGPNLGYVTVAILGAVVISQWGFEFALVCCAIILLFSALIFRIYKYHDYLRTTPEMYR